MTDTLYRWVKASERLPDRPKDYSEGCTIVLREIKTGKHKVGFWGPREGFKSLLKTNPSEYEWLELCSPSDFRKEIISDANDETRRVALDWAKERYPSSVDHLKMEGAYYGFLAGAAYVKGGEEKGKPIFNTLKPISSDKLLAEYSKLRPADVDRDNDYSPLQDLFMNEIATHLKLYTNPEVFEKAWIASLFPERLTKACLRATEQYIDSLPSRPSLDIDKVVRELREANPWLRDPYHGEQGMAGIWNDCCNKLKELLNQKEGK